MEEAAGPQEAHGVVVRPGPMKHYSTMGYTHQISFMTEYAK